MAEPEQETVTVTVSYFVDIETDASATPTRFGPVHTYGGAEQLLLVLAGRSDVKRATLVKEIPS